MVFYIHDQGARVTTPVDRLLKHREVSALDKTSASRAVGRQTPMSEGAQSASSEQRAASAEYVQLQRQPDKAKRRQLIYAHEIMSQPVLTGALDLTLDNAWGILAQNGFHHIPVIDRAGCLCGIVSDRDFLRYTANNSENRAIGNTPVVRIMTKKVISAAAETQIRTIAEVMCTQAIGAVPIVDEGSVVVGIVTRSDILRTLVNQAPIELWA